eukprot:gene7542-9273_t
MEPNTTNNNNKKQVWYVTGCTSGLGLALVEKLLENGEFVAGTSRNLEKLSTLSISKHPNFLALETDTVTMSTVKETIKKTIERFGTIDNIVNNAGYPEMGAVEELTSQQLLDQFQVNLHGPWNVIQAVLPHFREKKRGRIYNVSSLAAFLPLNRGGAYSASKSALNGLSEVLQEEVREFGIQIVIVMPGSFESDIRNNAGFPEQGNELDIYHTKDTINERFKRLAQIKIGDPKKYADLVYHINSLPDPPLYLFVGKDATELAQKQIDRYQNDLNRFKHLTGETNFD